MQVFDRMYSLVVSNIKYSFFFNANIILKFLASPGVFTHIQPCTVYEYKYIDCIIQAPRMVSAINNQYPYYFNFMEINRSLIPDDDSYNQPPELINIDSLNGTITFRWYPIKDGIFPSNLKMLISGGLRYFGSTNLTIDMKPSTKKYYI